MSESTKINGASDEKTNQTNTDQIDQDPVDKKFNINGRLSGQEVGDIEIRLQAQQRMLEERARELSERQRQFDNQMKDESQKIKKMYKEFEE